MSDKLTFKYSCLYLARGMELDKDSFLEALCELLAISVHHATEEPSKLLEKLLIHTRKEFEKLNQPKS